ncbi:TATA element modulatory factor [Anopheles maculipalpis]|uniref:TATA element modulatory factor n=1 Tax=Anopheles maculipalpis TaxID=1496333 RepID=UPI00215929AB|nr:TATA element modulatory factor [Anopheles maculipalpis]
MSWFDTKGIANLAKNALKEAQKQIDKALDIKDDDETASINDTMEPAEKKNDELATNSLTLSEVSGHPSVAGNNSTSSNTLNTSFEACDGSFFDQPINNSSTVTKPPSSLKCRSFENSKNGNIVGSPNTEVDSSESIEVLTPITNSGSDLTSTSRRSSSIIILQDDGESESVEVVGTIRTSPVSTPVDNDFPKHCEKDEDETSVEDDSISNTLSEQPITILETDVCLLPITVAPSRSKHKYSVSNAPPVSIAKDALEKSVEECKELSVPSTTSSNKTHTIAEQTADYSVVEPVMEEYRYKYSIDDLHLKQTTKSDQTLDQSYESIQTQMSDMAHSFEEIRSGSNDTLGHLPTIISLERINNTDQFSDTVFESPVGVGGNQSLFQSLGDDEIDTTTSSDIEIISSPNGGDSSSNHSGAYRTSPMKIIDGKSDNFDMLLIKKRRGHTREPSEISINSGNSDDSGHLSETERLMRRLVEVSETLEQREYRLVELGRQNAELNEQNAQLTAQLESKAKREGASDLDGYMQRLSALERKFQQSIREKESLKCKLEALKTEAQEKIPKSDMEKALIDRDFMINELQKEGESLSKQVLQHSNIIKKLRVKEKENDVLIRRQCDEIVELTQETERLKRSLSAKDEVERAQIVAVHKLTSEKRKLERECASLTGNLDDQTQKYESLRKSLEFARKDLNEKAELCKVLQNRLTKLHNCESDFLSFQRTNKILMDQMEDLREQLRRSEHDNGQRLIRAKNEHVELLRRLEASETRAEEEKNASALLTVPLIKQLESLQCVLRQKERLWEQRDASFTQQLSEAIERVKMITEKEVAQRYIITTLQDRINTLEEQLTATILQTEETLNNIKQKTHDTTILERKDLICVAETECLQRSDTSTECPRTSSSNSECIYKSPASENRLLENPNEIKMQADSNSTLLTEFDMRLSGTSPTHSIGNLSLPDSLNSIPWNGTEENLGVNSIEKNEAPDNSLSNVGYNVSIMLNNTSLIETLQSTLKQRDGEVYQLQWEVSRFQQERNVLSSEISNLTMELDNVRERFERSIRLEVEHKDLQNRYDALLQMYGESVEKTEELQLDLADVKEMYKIQIDDLLQRQRDLIASMNHPPSLISSPGNSC